MYDGTNKKLPSVLVTDNTVIAPVGWSWGVLILPYIEQKNVYDALPGLDSKGNPVTPPAVNIVAPTYPAKSSTSINYTNKLTLFRCPSDISPDINDNYGSYSAVNYVANREVMGPGRKSGGAVMDGLSIPGIKDGASNTILLGERQGDLFPGAALVYFDASGKGGGVDTSAVEGRPGKGLNPDPKSYSVLRFGTGDAQRYAYSSEHTGGSQFAMGDGRVIFIANSVAVNSTVDDWTYFPCQGVTAGATLQLLQNPADRIPVSID